MIELMDLFHRVPFLFLVALLPATLLGDHFATENFVVDGPPSVAETIGERAEALREELAMEWTGRPLPHWESPCPIHVEIQSEPPQGTTSHRITPWKETIWEIRLSGTFDRVLRSVLPHEVLHAVLSTYFGAPVPRWASEGMATNEEAYSERYQYQQEFAGLAKMGRYFSLQWLFSLSEYPSDKGTFYAQSHSITRFLLERGGRRHFLQFLQAAHDSKDWTMACEDYYAFENLSQLQKAWLDWVRQGELVIPLALAADSDFI